MADGGSKGWWEKMISDQAAGTANDAVLIIPATTSPGMA
jgi:hypothetical protein